MGRTHTKTKYATIDSRAHGFENSCGLFIIILATSAILAKVVRQFFPH